MNLLLARYLPNRVTGVELSVLSDDLEGLGMFTAAVQNWTGGYSRYNATLDPTDCSRASSNVNMLPRLAPACDTCCTRRLINA